MPARTYNDPPIPDYTWVPGTPDKNGSINGCNGCDNRTLSTGIRCSRIPCQTKPGQVIRWSRSAAAGDAVRERLGVTS